MTSSFNYFRKQRDFVLVFPVFTVGNKGAQAYFFFPCRSLLAHFSPLRSCWRSLSRGNLVFITNTEPPPPTGKTCRGPSNLPDRGAGREAHAAHPGGF